MRTPETKSRGLSINTTIRRRQRHRTFPGRISNTIGIVVPELDNTFFSEVLAGAAEVADAHNLTMILCNTSNNAKKEKEALRMMEQQR